MSGSAGKNYSSKLRQEREGAANKLHAERAGKVSDKLSEHNTAISQGTKSAVHIIQKSDQALNAYSNDEAASSNNNVGTSAAEFMSDKAESTLETAQNIYDGHNRRQLKKALQASDFAEKSADAAGNTGRKSVKTAGNAIQETAGKAETAVRKITDGSAGAVKNAAQASGKAARSSGKRLREAGSMAGEAVSAGFHGAVSAENEDENVGVQSADAAAESAEGALRTARRVQYSAKLRSRKKAAVSEVRKSSAASGYYSASPYSRWRQKQDLKRMYAARHAGASESAGAKRSTAAEKAEALTDTEFANMIAEAEKYLGMAYVWGGSSPSTGFDCSGFVCWVINNCGNGWYVGRTTANGLLSYCTIVSEDELQPGDLVFFENTYSTTGASHVGIYVGDGMMIHAGDPISYTSIETSYWQSHLLCYARLNQ